MTRRYRGFSGPHWIVRSSAKETLQAIGVALVLLIAIPIGLVRACMSNVWSDERTSATAQDLAQADAAPRKKIEDPATRRRRWCEAAALEGNLEAFYHPSGKFPILSSKSHGRCFFETEIRQAVCDSRDAQLRETPRFTALCHGLKVENRLVEYEPAVRAASSARQDCETRNQVADRIGRSETRQDCAALVAGAYWGSRVD